MGMGIILEQLSLLFLFMLAGFALGKSGIIQHEHTRILSTLCVYLFTPCTVFNAFYSSFKVSNLTRYYPLILTALGIMVFMILFWQGVFRFSALDGYEKRIYKYSLVASNYGYMGYALAEGIFGAEGLLNMVLFCVPFGFYVSTVGLCMLTLRKGSLKLLINPQVLALILGAVFGVFSIGLPGVMESFIDKSAGCMAPVSMLLAGLTISEFNVKQLLFDRDIYIVSLLRLVAIPAAALLVMRPFCDPILVRTAVLMLAMPAGLNVIVYPKLIGKDCGKGAKLVFISNVLCVLTIPLLLRFV